MGGLDAKTMGLRILTLGLKTATTTRKLVLNVLEAVARFERQIMLDR